MRRFLFVGLSAVVGAGTLVGCGHSAVDTIGQARAAPAKTVAAGSADIRVVVLAHGMTGVANGTVLTVSGSYDFAHRAGRLDMTMPAPGAAFGKSAIPVVEIGSVLYERLPDAITAAAGAKPWVRVDVSDASKITGVDVAGLTAGQSTDPTQALDQLREIAGPLRSLGGTKVNGVAVQRYAGTIDLDQAARNSPPRRRQALESTQRMVGITRYPVELWIDGDGRLRHMQTELDLSHARLPTPGDPSTKMSLTGGETVTVDLSNFGVPVHVSAPPNDQVSDLSALLHTRDSAPTPAASAPATPAPVAAGSATTLLRQAIDDLTKAGSAHLDVETTSPGHHAVYSDDATMSGGTQDITADGARAYVLFNGKTAYIRGDARALTSYFGLPANRTGGYAGRWLSVLPTDEPFTTVVDGVSLAAVVRNIDLTGELALTPATTVAGQRAVGIRGTLAEGDVPATLYVTLGANPTPVQLVAGPPDGTRETVTFSRLGEPVGLPVPVGATRITKLTS